MPDWFTVPDHLFSDLLCTLLFGLLLIVLAGFGVKFIDKYIWKQFDMEMQVQNGNIAAAIVMASTVLGLFGSLAYVVRGILG